MNKSVTIRHTAAEQRDEVPNRALPSDHSALSPTDHVRLLFISLESLQQKQRSKALNRILLQYQQTWRVLWYSIELENKRAAWMQWLQKRKLWQPENTLVMMAPTFNRPSITSREWKIGMIHTLSPVFGARSSRDRIVVFDTEEERLNKLLKPYIEHYPFYSPIEIVSTAQGLLEILQSGQ